MPINTDLNRNPYYDDFATEKQFYKVLFKPSFAVQARELTQLQSILQNQVEQFGDNIFKEGSIIKGCNFSELTDLQFVRVINQTGFDPTLYVGEIDADTGFEVYYELYGSDTGLRASIEAAARGTQSAFPDLNTFFINYLNSPSGNEVFNANEPLTIQRKMVDNEGQPVPEYEDTDFARINSSPSNATGKSFGIRCSEGIIYQKGQFLYVEDQLLIAAKYTNIPDNISVGFYVDETIVSYLQDDSLLDNANGSPNQNAPGADRLKLTPRLAVNTTSEAEVDPAFFTLARYINGTAVVLRDVSQYNVIGEELARRTYEESGNYITKPFKTQIIEKDSSLYASVGQGVGYAKGYRVENRGEYQFAIDQIDELSTSTLQNQPVSINYGNYLKIDTLSGNFNIPSYSTVSLRDADTAVEIGTAIVKNMTPDKIYIFGVKMDAGENFADVGRIVGTSGYVDVASTALKGTKNSAFIFDSGAFSVKSLTDISMPVRVKSSPVVVTAGVFSINAGVGEDFSIQNDDIVVVDSSNVYKPVDVVTTSVGSTVLNVTLVDTSLTGNVSVYYNKRIQLTSPYNKISKTTYIKSSYSSGTNKYNLGFPDVYEIVSITDSAGADVKSSFKLRKNQNNHFYDHSYIEYVPGRREPAAGLMTINLKVFQLNTSTGSYFFTADSYPTDPLTFPINKIPTYKTPNGKVYNLRECVDFRPYVDNVAGANYNITSAGSAPTIPATVDIVPAFSGTQIIPALNSAIFADIEFYHNRTDVICIDSYGTVNYIKGEEDIDSKPANVGEKMVIAELYIPGYPAISAENAVSENKKEYAIKITSRGDKAYTMKDIAKIDNAVKKLTYYVALTALETATDALTVTDADGLNRFKNGIIVDTFTDFTIADTADPSFRAGLDFTEKSLIPTVRTLPINLVVKDYDSENGVELFPRAIESFGETTIADIAMLTKDVSDVSIINQPYATNFRNCVSNYYYFRGNGYLYPPYDTAPDVINNPAINFDINLTPYFEDLIDNIQEFIPLTSTSSELINSVVVDQTTNGNSTTTIFEDTFSDIQTSLAVNEVTTSQQIGDFVTNVQFSPFMRPKEISVIMYGLRANTRHWVFFDKTDVNSNVAPATILTDQDGGTGNEIAREITRTGAYGDPIYSDDNGVLICVFSLPAETFYVGDRILEIANVDQYTSIESAANSKGFLTYSAYNFSIEKSGLTASTRGPDFSIDTSVTERNTTRRQVVRRRENEGRDPLAQTFFIKKAMARNTASSVFATKLDLYFKSKSSTRGVTVELREVINGYPSYEVLPFSKVHLNSADVNVSDDGSLVTVINFPAPIKLDVDKEYSFVVMPDGSDPDYTIFTCKVGQEDLITNTPITNDWGDGVLFTSTNNRAWQSYQDEDVKFKLYRANYSDTSGEIILTNDNHEFLSISNPVGVFNLNELVYKETAAGISIGVQNGNTTITTSSGTAFSSLFSVGDYILIEGVNVPKNIYKIADPQSTEALLESGVIASTASATATATPIVAGNLAYYNRAKPNFIMLEKSSARLGKSFDDGDNIEGLVSGSTATISTVDDITLGYMQPIISRINENATNITATGTFTDVDDINISYSTNMPFNNKTEFNKKGMQIRSRSNDLSRISPFDITLTLRNTGAVTSTPVVDIETAALLGYQYFITDDPEANPENAVVYISKEVELADSFDATDFILYVTGYRPNGTDIKTYIKVQNGADPTSFTSLDWIELEKNEGQTLYSSTSNTSDFREYVYSIPEADKDGFGEVAYTSSSGNFTGYKKFAVKIELISNNTYRVPRVSDYRGIALA